MPDPIHVVSQQGESPDFEVMLARLSTILHVAKGGMSFIFVVCNSIPLRNRVLAKAEPDLAGALRVEVTDPTMDAFELAVQNCRSGHPTAVVVTGLDISLLSNDHGAAALTALNASRELWWDRFNCPVLFFVSDESLDRIVRAAPDLWSRRSHVVYFPNEVAHHRQAILHHNSSFNSDIQSLTENFRSDRESILRQRLASSLTNVTPQQRIEWLQELGQILFTKRRLTESLATFQTALNLATEAAQHRLAAQSAVWVAQVLSEQGNFKESLRTLISAQSEFEKHTSDRALVRTLLDPAIAEQLAVIGQTREAMVRIGRALMWAESKSPRDEHALAGLYAIRARVRSMMGDLKGAEEDIAKSITWAEAQTPRDERGLAVWYELRGSIRQQRGDLRSAIADIARSIAWAEAQSPRDERGLAILYVSRARVLYELGELNRAHEDISTALGWVEAQSPRDEHAVAVCYSARAQVLQALGDLRGAERDIARVIAWQESQIPVNSQSLAMDYVVRASIRQALGDLIGADQDVGRAIQYLSVQTPRDERALAINLSERARIRLAQALAAKKTGDLKSSTAFFDIAKADIAAALTWWESNLPDDERGLRILRSDLADIEKAAAAD